MLSRLRWAVLRASVLLLLGLMFIFFGQRPLIFPAPNGTPMLPRTEWLEPIELDRGGALLLRPPGDATNVPLIVFAHGNAELAAWWISDFDRFRERGLAVLLLEYPGYAGTRGKPGSEAILTSALTAFDNVVGRDWIDDSRVVVYGRSIGSGVAAAVTQHRSVGGLVLESPFTSLADLASEKGFPAFLLRDTFDNARAVAALDAPVLLYHGSNDRIIPLSHSQRLKQIGGSRVELVTAPCGHNDCPRPYRAVEAFLSKLGF